VAPLLLLTVTGLVASVFLKARATMRLGMGLSPLVMLEALMALALLGMLMPGLPRSPIPARWSTSIALLLLLASTVDHARRLAARRRRRALSEGGRLSAYLRARSSVSHESPFDTRRTSDTEHGSGSNGRSSL